MRRDYIYLNKNTEKYYAQPVGNNTFYFDVTFIGIALLLYSTSVGVEQFSCNRSGYKGHKEPT